MKTIGVMLLGVGLLVTSAVSAPAAKTEVRGVSVELRLSKAVYSVGESVESTLILRNPGASSASFQFSTGQMYDFIVIRGQQRIWQWSSGRAFTQAFTTLTLQPGESKRFIQQWDQRDSQGQQVAPGEYELVAVFPARGDVVVPASSSGPRVQFSITERSGSTRQRRVPTVTGRVSIVGGTTVGEVVVDSRVALRIRTAAGGVSVAERAGIVAARLRRLLARGFKPEELTVKRVGAEAAIMWRDELVVTVDANHARLTNTTPFALAIEWRKVLTQALAAAR